MKKAKVFAPQMWINGETCLMNFKDPIEHRMGNLMLLKMRSDFLRQLETKGYEVVMDSNEVDEDTICLVVDAEHVVKSSKKDHIALKDYVEHKISRVGGENYHFPHSVPIEDYLAHPFFPAVFKNTLQNGGVDKFLIESPRQLETIRKFYNMSRLNPKYIMEWQYIIAQQFIESPTEYSSYMRVLVSGSGEVLGSSLKFSRKKPNSFSLNGTFEQIFLRPESPFYINGRKMFNYYAGGDNISLETPGDLDEEQKRVLRAHGIDPENPRVPDEVLDVCQNIMRKCNRELGVICGIDFMLNRGDGKWYYLENQSFPAIDEWAHNKGIKMPENHDLLGYIEVLAIDLRTRFEALEQTFNYKNSLEKDKKEI